MSGRVLRMAKNAVRGSGWFRNAVDERCGVGSRYQHAGSLALFIQPGAESPWWNRNSKSQTLPQKSSPPSRMALSYTVHPAPTPFRSQRGIAWQMLQAHWRDAPAVL